MPARAVYLDWIKQVENASTYSSHGVSADSLGHVYIVGSIRGGSFLAKYDALGNLQWTQPFGPDSGRGYASGVSADALGNVYVSGNTPVISGHNHVFVSKYDAAGNLQWTRQQGMGQEQDLASGVSADGLGNAYITGVTTGNLPDGSHGEAFVSKYDATGNLQWMRQQGTTIYEYSHSVSADGLGHVYIAGSNTPDGASDAFVSKYDAAGNFLWNRQVGVQPGQSTEYWGYGVSADPVGNVYMTLSTDAGLEGSNAGLTDALLRKYDAAGNVQWTQLFGSPQDFGSTGISADRLGDVYVTGNTQGSFGAVNNNAFLTKYDASGVLQWMQTLGPGHTDSQGVSADSLGNVYIAGGMPDNSGVRAPYVAKYVPEPPTFLLSVLTLLGFPLLCKKQLLAKWAVF
jgi:hypothetical protein